MEMRLAQLSEMRLERLTDKLTEVSLVSLLAGQMELRMVRLTDGQTAMQTVEMMEMGWV